MRFKNLEGKSERESSKRTSGSLSFKNLEEKPERKIQRGQVETSPSRRVWESPRKTSENPSSQRCFINFEGKPERKSPKRTSGDLS